MFETEIFRVNNEHLDIIQLQGKIRINYGNQYCTCTVDLPELKLFRLYGYELILKVEWNVEPKDYELRVRYLYYHPTAFCISSCIQQPFDNYKTYKPVKISSRQYQYTIDKQNFLLQDLYFKGLQPQSLNLFLEEIQMENNSITRSVQSGEYYHYNTGNIGINCDRYSVKVVITVPDDILDIPDIPLLIATGYKTIIYGNNVLFDKYVNPNGILYLDVEGYYHGDIPQCSQHIISLPHMTHAWYSFKNADVLPRSLFDQNQLAYLNISHNKLRSIDLSRFPNLETLDISHNYLEKLDLSHNYKLNTVHADYNLLTELIRPSNTKCHITVNANSGLNGQETVNSCEISTCCEITTNYPVDTNPELIENEPLLNVRQSPEHNNQRTVFSHIRKFCNSFF